MMKRKTKTQLRKMRDCLPTADYALHCRLRDILAKEGPSRFAKLRNEHGIDPIDLERQHQSYPDVFYVVESEQGRFPVIALHENPPTREDSLMKKQLVVLVQKAGPTGVYLSSLRYRTTFNSSDIERLLKEVTQIEAKPVSRKGFLYRWIGTPTKTVEESRIQDAQPAADPLPEPVGAAQPTPAPVVIGADEFGREISEEEHAELKFHPNAPGAHARRPTIGQRSFYARDGRVRARHEPPGLSKPSLTYESEDQPPMTIKQAHKMLFKYIADGFENGRHLKQLTDTGLSGDTIQAVFAAYPKDFMIEDIKEVSETLQGKVTKYRIVARIVRIAPELLTATKSVRVTDMSGDYEVEHAYPVLANGNEELEATP